ncbi:MAG: hypothetical protein RBT19_09180 [Tenuifilaceae bacterium]|jgi:hypothetical protein|nr:hypothetical protein [Tenuifilaceae bacterium]
MSYMKYILLFAALMIGTLAISAQEKEEEKKLDLKFYGFIKGDMVYATDGVNSFGANTLAAPQVANGDEQSAIGFTAQHTRIGLKGTVGEEIKAGGLVEIDFFSNAFDANGKPRIRLAYASIAKGGFEARMGQQWDLFSPNNANTNHTNGNMWFAGNRGFRRAQLQLSYKLDIDNVFPMVQVSLGETTREDVGLGKDNLSGVPMLQARLSGKLMDKYTVGVSFVNGQYQEKGSAGPWDWDDKITTTGFGFDFNLPIHQYFSLVGEVNSGTNLNNANLFNIAGNYGYNINPIAGNSVDDKKCFGLWLNASSKVTDWLLFTIGYGMDKNNSENFNVGNYEANSMVYTNFTLPIKHGFALMLEYQILNTTQVTGVDAQGQITDTQDNKANVFGVAARISF